jgi:hypothetical protein
MSKKWTRRSALGLIGSGAGLLTWGTGGFTEVQGDRDVSLDTTDDANAILGIEAYADTTTVTTFTNTTTSEVTITLDSSEDVEFDVRETGSYELTPVTFGIGAGAWVNVGIQDGGNAGSDADIDITAAGEDFSLQATRNFVIPASSAVREIKPTVTATGNSGKYEFELENTGSSTVTLTEIGVVQTTNNSIVRVGGKNNDPIFENVTTGNSIVNNVITVGGDRQPLESQVDIDPGTDNAIKFEFDRFRDGNNNNGAMKDDDVRISVAFDDGSSATFDLCVGGSCDFA